VTRLLILTPTLNDYSRERPRLEETLVNLVVRYSGYLLDWGPARHSPATEHSFLFCSRPAPVPVRELNFSTS
jgi:hypothetical protein